MKPFVAFFAAFASLSMGAATAQSLGAVTDSARIEAAFVTPDSIAPYVPRSSPDPRSFDVRAFRLLNDRIANPVFDAMMPFVTDLDRWRVMILLVWAGLVFFGRSKGRWAALMLIPLIAVSDQLASSIIKPLAGRMRPCEVLGSVHLWHGVEGWITTPAEVMRSYKASFSFPSSHAANITASMLFLGLAYRRLIAPLIAIAALVGISRIYIGVHWPSDVLAGAAIGAALGWLAYLAFGRLYSERGEWAPAGRSEPEGPPSE